MKLLSRSLPLAGLLLSGAAHAAPSADMAARQVEAAQEAAWNAHDAHAFMATFTPDADIVTAEGHRTQSRDKAEQRLAGDFSTVFAGSSMHVDDVAVRGLTPDLVFVHVTWTLTGLQGPAVDPVHLIQTQLLERHGGSWLISSAQSTASLPEGYRPPAATPPLPLPQVATPQQPPAPPKPCLLANRWGTCLIEGHAKKKPSGG